MSNKQYKSKRDTAERYNKAGRTIDRWVDDKELGFPQPMIINGRWHFGKHPPPFVAERWPLAPGSDV